MLSIIVFSHCFHLILCYCCSVTVYYTYSVSLLLSYFVITFLSFLSLLSYLSLHLSSLLSSILYPLFYFFSSLTSLLSLFSSLLSFFSPLSLHLSSLSLFSLLPSSQIYPLSVGDDAAIIPPFVTLYYRDDVRKTFRQNDHQLSLIWDRITEIAAENGFKEAKKGTNISYENYINKY